MGGETGNTAAPPEIKLYWLDRSRSQRIVWLLEELQTPYEIIISHRDKQLKAPPSHARIHSLGKFPVVRITPPDGGEPVTLAESGFITQYLCEHLPTGARLVPTRWRPGREGTVGGETKEWLRYEYLMHYVEGSLMPMLVLFLVLEGFRSKKLPIVIRSVTSRAAGTVMKRWIKPDATKHLTMLEGILAENEEHGWVFLCGPTVSAADILISFPLISAKAHWNNMGGWRGGSWVNEFPRVAAYTELLEKEDGYQRSVDKIKSMDGGFSASL
ncbi:hypothetical protein XA68_16262 [Ophiocordyceps unilateralis]|uniref:GST N-terminal domain-containing protein n=1 Tax=Ophiocordyceps unilateralis TaxID=268505 RepID=A0A2A9P6V7_OPHUN|nr:hypothetical protein XA68_16262 [Ophiocordyceps unilateralis]